MPWWSTSSSTGPGRTGWANGVVFVCASLSVGLTKCYKCCCCPGKAESEAGKAFSTLTRILLTLSQPEQPPMRWIKPVPTTDPLASPRILLSCTLTASIMVFHMHTAYSTQRLETQRRSGRSEKVCLLHLLLLLLFCSVACTAPFRHTHHLHQ